MFLNNNSLTDDGVISLYIPSQLKNLNLSHNDFISDLGLISLCPKLESLNQISLNGLLRVSARGWRALSQHCPQLKILECRRCALQDEAMLGLFGPNSKLISLRQVLLTGNMISDVGLAVLGQYATRFPYLEVVNLDSNHITDACVEEWKPLLQDTRIRELNLNRNSHMTDISASRLVELMQSRVCLRVLRFEGFSMSFDEYKKANRVPLMCESHEFQFILNLCASSWFPKDLLRLLLRMLF